MRIFIARHGQKASTDPEYDGGPNPPLTETGKKQAAHLAEFLETQEIDEIYSSCQLRSLQTAQPAAERVDAPWNVWPVFSESSPVLWTDRNGTDPNLASQLAAWRTGEQITAEAVGDHNGNGGYLYPLTEVTETFPGTRLNQPFPWPNEWWVPIEGGTRSMGYARAELGLNAVLERHDEDDTIALICHGNINDMMITALLDIPRRSQGRRFAFNNTAVARVDGTEGDWRIVYTNRTSHLPPELRV